ncbi:MAG: AAA family ATPase [Pseudomonadota bacterium]
MPAKNQASTEGYRRTALRRVHIRGYRSLRDLTLEGLPDLVVLHGPNGVGKSNILRAVRLALAAATQEGELPIGRENGRDLSWVEADRRLGFRADDFCANGPQRLTVELGLDLGPRAVEVVKPPEGGALATLSLAFVLESVQSTGIRFWFERAELDGGRSLGPETEPRRRSQLQQLDQWRANHANAVAVFEAHRVQLADAQTSGQGQAARSQQLQAQVRQYAASVESAASQIRALESQLGEAAFLAERVRRTLLPGLLRISEAYRVPDTRDDPQGALFRAYLSEDLGERRVIQRLGRLLGAAHLFGAEGGEVTPSPWTAPPTPSARYASSTPAAASYLFATSAPASSRSSSCSRAA